MRLLVAAALGLGAALLAARYAYASTPPAASEEGGWMPDFSSWDFAPTAQPDVDQSAGILDSIVATFDPSAFTPPPAVSVDTAGRNERALLDAIAWAEGTAGGPSGGYDVLFGWPAAGRTFNSNGAIDHPRVFFPFRTTRTSAAGRYQITATTYDALRRKYANLPAGFGPAAQDAMALTLIRERGALVDLHAGRLGAAVSKIRTIWASLPGSGWDQPERTQTGVQAAYVRAGGTLEA